MIRQKKNLTFLDVNRLTTEYRVSCRRLRADGSNSLMCHYLRFKVTVREHRLLKGYRWCRTTRCGYRHRFYLVYMLRTCTGRVIHANGRFLTFTPADVNGKTPVPTPLSVSVLSDYRSFYLFESQLGTSICVIDALSLILTELIKKEIRRTAKVIRKNVNQANALRQSQYLRKPSEEIRPEDTSRAELDGKN
ncbi:hypothetical protein K501DRAFT_276527 [Backusella circina FSU 941]|nr:hypothetical protein K501DRAFT_276527 [Backusella circina FSU 941]